MLIIQKNNIVNVIPLLQHPIVITNKFNLNNLNAANQTMTSFGDYVFYQCIQCQDMNELYQDMKFWSYCPAPGSSIHSLPCQCLPWQLTVQQIGLHFISRRAEPISCCLTSTRKVCWIIGTERNMMTWSPLRNSKLANLKMRFCVQNIEPYLKNQFVIYPYIKIQ